MIKMPLVFKELQGELLCDQPLSDYTSWRIGGRADYIYLPANIADLARFLPQIPTEVPITWLGLGSNTLIRDGGIAGVVIVTQGRLHALSHQLTADHRHQIRAEAGVASAQLARFSARLNAAGLEFLAGIPGTIGGALAMNAGCFGGETWPHVLSVETIDRQGVIRTRHPQAFTIHYRHVEKPVDEWFVAGNFLLSAGEKEASLAKIRELLERRSQTQPTGTANCGSVFKNPQGEYAGKLFAGKLIEECGLKGKAIGGAAVSTLHGNFIVNTGDARAKDIEELILLVKDTVHKMTGVLLQQEVCIAGRVLDE